MHARTTLLPPKPTEQQRAHTHTHTLSRDKPGPGQSSRTNWRTGKRKSPAPSNPWPPAWQRTRRELRVGATALSSAAQREGAPLQAPRDTAEPSRRDRLPNGCVAHAPDCERETKHANVVGNRSDFVRPEVAQNLAGGKEKKKSAQISVCGKFEGSRLVIKRTICDLPKASF